MADLLGIDRRKHKDNESYKKLLTPGNIPSAERTSTRLKIMLGRLEHKENGISTDEYSNMYDRSRYRFLLDAPFEISNKCCAVMKKAPLNEYARRTGRHPITAQMASESKLRTTIWLKNGCNAFDAKHPISNPMSFWFEQDVLEYIYQNNIEICSVYGNVVKDNEIEGQLDWADLGIFDIGRSTYHTTGCERTGCMFCGYGCHNEKGVSRFERIKQTHPKIYDYIMRPWEDGGLGYKEVIDWINENGNLNIRH